MILIPIVRSRKILDHANGQRCTLRFPSICNHDPATTVACHIRDKHKGMAQKASDYSIVWGCCSCHDYLDLGHGTSPIMTDLEVAQSVIRALQETWSTLIQDGIIIVPRDRPKVYKPRPRKPRAERKAMPSRPMRQPKSNSIDIRDERT